MSFRIVPNESLPTHKATVSSAPSAPGIPDRLRIGLRASGTLAPGGEPGTRSGRSGILGPDGSIISAPTSSHPLESRLLQWNATQRAFQLQQMRVLHGSAAPIQREMDALIVRTGEWKPQALGGTCRIHGDILDGKEAAIDWEDVFVDDVIEQAPDLHSEVETKLMMNW